MEKCECANMCRKLYLQNRPTLRLLAQTIAENKSKCKSTKSKPFAKKKLLYKKT